MKKTKSLLALFLCVAVLASLVSALGINAFAAESVTKTVEFTSLAETTDKTAAAESIKSVGVYEVSNMQIQPTWAMCVTPGGYAGEGYIVVKLDAGEGKVFASDPVVDLTYWLADVSSKGYVKVEGSLDNETYYEFYKDETGLGGEYENGQSQNKQITLAGGAGAATVYVKVLAQHWGSMYCGAIQKVIVSGDVQDDPNATPDDGGEQPAGDTVAATVDLSTQPETEDKDAAAELIKAAGAYEVSNLKLQNTYFGTAHPGGYAGDGYIVVKLDAGEGKVFASDPVVDLTYWLADVVNAEVGVHGSIKVEGSLDNETYYEYLNDNTGAGSEYSDSSKIEKQITLVGGAGAATVYAKVTVQHWGSPYCGAIQKVTVSASVQDDPNAAPDEGDDNDDNNTAGGDNNDNTAGGDNNDDNTAVDPSVPPKTITGTLDFSTLSKDADAAEAILGLGAVDVDGLCLEDCHTVFTAPKDGYAPAYYVQKLSAGEGKTFLTDPTLTLNYRMATSDPVSTIKIEVSTDGETYKEITTLNETTGAPFSTECKVSKDITLTGVKGAENVYVKVTMTRYGAHDSAGVDSSVITASVPGDKAADDGNDNTAVKTKTITNLLNFGKLQKYLGDATNILKGIGAVDAAGLMVEDCYTPFIAPKDGYAPAYYVQKLSAGEGATFTSDATLLLKYRMSTSDPLSTIKIEVSTDGKNYTEVKTISEGNGAAFTTDCKANASIALPGTKGASEVYVKVTMTRFGGPDSAGVDSSLISAEVPDDGKGDSGSGSPVTGNNTMPIAICLTVLAAALATVILTTRKSVKGR